LKFICSPGQHGLTRIDHVSSFFMEKDS